MDESTTLARADKTCRLGIAMPSRIQRGRCVGRLGRAHLRVPFVCIASIYSL